MKWALKTPAWLLILLAFPVALVGIALMCLADTLLEYADEGRW